MHNRKYRKDRVGKEIMKALSEILRNDIKDPRIGLVTITEVVVTRDLSKAKVYIGNLQGIKEGEESLDGLNSGKGYIRQELAKKMDLRIVPELEFEIDNSLEHSFRINKILKDLENND